MTAAAPSFGLAFGSLVLVRALLNGGYAGIGVTLIMFVFFAGIAAAAYLAGALLRRGPLVTAVFTALALLCLIALPFLIAAPLTLPIAVRIGVRFCSAWLYVSVVFAVLSRMVRMHTKVLAIFVLTSLAMFGQLVEEFSAPRANCCLQSTAQALADQLQDWNQLGRYHADNVKLLAQPAEAGRVVFLGDSITDGWKLAQSFPGKPYVNRGIGGQTTPQMLVRMFPDVINLKPAAVILLAGTNDIARNTGRQRKR